MADVESLCVEREVSQQLQSLIGQWQIPPTLRCIGGPKNGVDMIWDVPETIVRLVVSNKNNESFKIAEYVVMFELININGTLIKKPAFLSFKRMAK